MNFFPDNGLEMGGGRKFEGRSHPWLLAQYSVRELAATATAAASTLDFTTFTSGMLEREWKREKRLPMTVTSAVLQLFMPKQGPQHAIAVASRCGVCPELIYIIELK